MSTTVAAATTSAKESKLEMWEAAIHVTVLGVLLLGSVVGNIMVCLCVYLKQEMRSITAMFLVNLAIADLGTGIFSLPMAIASVIDVSILHSKVTCNLNAFCIVLFFTSSINTMAATSVYKYWTVGFAMKSKVTRKRALLMIACIWLISVALAAGPLFGWNKYHLLHGRYQCSPNPPRETSEYLHLFALLLFGYAIPVPLMTFCYARIYLISKSHFKRMKENAVSDVSLLKSEAHLITTLWIVLIAFIFCWLPFVIYLVAGILNKTIPFHLPILAFTFGYSNSILNPLVYGLRVKSFRAGFKEILFGCHKKKHSVPAYLTYNGDTAFATRSTTNPLRPSLTQSALKEASIAYLLSGSDNKAFVLEEGTKASRKMSEYKISATTTYPMMSCGSTSRTDNSSSGIEDRSSNLLSKQIQNDIMGTVAVIGQRYTKPTNGGQSYFEAAIPRLYPRLSTEGPEDDKQIHTIYDDCVDGEIHSKKNNSFEDEDIWDIENAQDNGVIKLDEKSTGTSFETEVEVLSLTETRNESFTKMVNLCQNLEDKSPHGEYKITRHIDTRYDIHVIVNPTSNQISEFGSPCINKVLRTLTWKDVYFDSLGNKAMTKHHEITKNEDLGIQELPLYMREHVQLLLTQK